MRLLRNVGGNDKHSTSTPETCSRAQPPYNCINCSGDHLATSHLCPEVIKHKMILSLASTQNILFSETKKSVYPQFNDSPSSQYSDPRFDFQNFPNLPSPRSNSLLSTFESFNKFSILQNCMNNSSRFSPSDSFASARKKFGSLESNYNNKKSTPSPHHSIQQPSPRGSPFPLQVTHPSPGSQHISVSSPLIPRDHYDMLAYPNGRPLSSSSNEIALAGHPPHLMNPMDTSPALPLFYPSIVNDI